VPSKKSFDPKAVAADWLTKYGKPIDCPELRRVASLAAVERERSAVSALRALGDYAELLRRQRHQQIAFLEHRVPGEDAVLGERVEAAHSASGERDRRRQQMRIDDYVELLESDTKRPNCGAPQRNVLALPRHAHPTELFLALRLAQRSAASRADEMVSEMLHRTPDWRWKAKTQGADVALALAACEVAEWIRKRHRNKSGQLDESTSWPDVAFCFEWYGHDFSHIGGEKGEALRVLASRIQKKRAAAEKAAATAMKSKAKK
jgi:hypothetical protein